MGTRIRNRIYTNGEITIYWQASECIHASTCFSELRSVFNPMKRPWIDPSGASSERIKEVIEMCPSNALMFKWNDKGRNATETSSKLFTGDESTLFFIPKNSDQHTSIEIRRNGPIIVSDNFHIINEEGGKMQDVKMTSLCRCGESSSKPMCDGTHFAIGFKD